MMIVKGRGKGLMRLREIDSERSIEKMKKKMVRSREGRWTDGDKCKGDGEA